MVPFGGAMSDILPLPLTPLDSLDESGGRALVEAWRASGLSGAAYSRSQGLRPQRLHYWLERLGYPMRSLGDGCRQSAAAAPIAGRETNKGHTHIRLGELWTCINSQGNSWRIYRPLLGCRQVLTV